jgi:mono/diheme cytochrome c family protein
MNRDTSAGKRIFDRSCGACHAPGTRNPGTASLAAKYGKEKPAALEQREDLTPDLVSYFVRHGVSIMPPFRKTEITDEELQDLGAYLGRDRAK